MKRSPIRIIITLALGLLWAPLAPDAQPPGKVPRIGFVGGGSASVNRHFLDAFRQGLRELGWVEGQNIAIEDRWAEGQVERFPDLVAELIRLKVDVLVLSSSAGVLAAKHATATVPIVFAGATTALDELVVSLARPGGNITGVTGIGPEMHGKRLELLREAIPHISRVAFLVEPYQAAVNMKVMEAAARALGITLQSLQVQDPTDLEEAFAAMTRERLDGLFVQGGPLTLSHRTRIVELAAKSQLPAIYTLREFVDAGGLMAYGGHLPDMFRRAAAYVDKILKGAKPADLPIERPMKFELVINLKTAKALGLTMPPSLLLLADEVIQ